MGRVDDYKKLIEEMMLPKMWVVYSDRKGVSMPRELQVISIENSGRRYYADGTEANVKKYKFDQSPYEVDMEDGKSSGTIEGYATGTGDLWCWTWFFSFSTEDALEFYLTEDKRVTEKYISKEEKETNLKNI